MRPIFTIHAGEFVFGEEVERRYPDVDLWIPAKDRGIDFLVTKHLEHAPLSIQVKMSRDFSKAAAVTEFDKSVLASGWFQFATNKIESSPAGIWSLIMLSRDRRVEPVFINIRPEDMLCRLQSAHGHGKKKYDIYPSVLRINGKIRCIDVRGLKKKEKDDLASGATEFLERDWTDRLGNWQEFDQAFK